MYFVSTRFVVVVVVVVVVGSGIRPLRVLSPLQSHGFWSFSLTYGIIFLRSIIIIWLKVLRDACMSTSPILASHPPALRATHRGHRGDSPFVSWTVEPRGCVCVRLDPASRG